MWFKLFILLRLPISAVCLFGYAILLSIWRKELGALAVILVLLPFIFLGFVSIKLVRLSRGAFSLAGWLLTVELIGAVLLLVGGDYVSGRRAAEPLGAFIFLCGILVVWIAPNVVIFYKAHERFIESANKKPGD